VGKKAEVEEGVGNNKGGKRVRTDELVIDGYKAERNCRCV
jgi:hypothetical protein